MAPASVRPLVAAQSPVTHATALAYGERTEVEYLVAKQIDVHRTDLLTPRPIRGTGPPDWLLIGSALMAARAEEGIDGPPSAGACRPCGFARPHSP